MKCRWHMVRKIETRFALENSFASNVGFLVTTRRVKFSGVMAVTYWLASIGRVKVVPVGVRIVWWVSMGMTKVYPVGVWTVCESDAITHAVKYDVKNRLVYKTVTIN